MKQECPFNKLDSSDLIVDCIYKGGTGSSADNEPLHHLFPKCGVNGGFRKVNRTDGTGKPAYVILYTTMSELEWPDYLDEETGVFRYYGDNRRPGREITDTKLMNYHHPDNDVIQYYKNLGFEQVIRTDSDTEDENLFKIQLY